MSPEVPHRAADTLLSRPARPAAWSSRRYGVAHPNPQMLLPGASAPPAAADYVSWGWVAAASAGPRSRFAWRSLDACLPGFETERRNGTNR